MNGKMTETTRLNLDEEDFPDILMIEEERPWTDY